ncbi:RING-type E3 ubiquitin transferase, partial [Sarracenia purpurea var. burkii]
ESRFSEGEDSNGHQEFEEDDIDPDELSYEELLTLGDIVGEESRGLSAEEISSCLSRYVPPSADCKTIIDRCVICQVEYDDTDIDTLVALPCKHPYHSECIRNWLQIKKICPVCGAEVSSSNAAGT